MLCMCMLTYTDTVYDSSEHKATVFTTNDTIIEEFGRQGSGDGEFDHLIGLAFDINTVW